MIFYDTMAVMVRIPKGSNQAAHYRVKVDHDQQTHGGCSGTSISGVW